MYACNGILFNHESPRRGEIFVTQKIVRGLVRVKLGIQQQLRLGNLDALRDWGHAKDYVEMMWLMLQQSAPRDYVAATGVQISVRQFVENVAAELDLKLDWKGSGLNECGYDQHGQAVVVVDERYFRPAEVETLLGDSSLAKRELGWQPTTSVGKLAAEMVKEELAKLT